MMKFKVVWKEHRFVVLTNKTNKVSDLYKDVANKFASYMTEEFIVSEIKTSDGFLVSPHYNVSDALNDNDVIYVVDFESWKTDQYKLCNKSFNLFALENYEQDNKTRVNVGLNTIGKLFISIGLYNKLYRLELFDSSDIKSFHKSGDHMVAHWEDQSTGTDNGNWAKVYFVVVDGVVKKVKSEISTTSSPKPLIQTIEIKLGNNGKIEAGTVETIQSAYVKYDKDSDVPVPDEIRTGKSYENYDDLDYEVTHGGNGTDESTFSTVIGPNNVRFEQVNIVHAEMSKYSSNGSYNNSFYTDFHVTNNSANTITITKLTGEYQNKQGEWVPLANCWFGSKKSKQEYDYDWIFENALIQFHPRDTIPLSFNSQIQIKGKSTDRLKRSHHSLPQELNIKIHIHDDKQGITTIPIVYKNKTTDPVFMTLKTRQSKISKPIVFFQTVDNLETNIRGWVQLTSTVDGDNNIFALSSITSNMIYHLSESTLNSFAYKAKKANQSKVKITDYCSSNSDFNLDFFANVNLSTLKVDSLTFELSDSGNQSKSIKNFSILKLSKQ